MRVSRERGWSWRASIWDWMLAHTAVNLEPVRSDAVFPGTVVRGTPLLMATACVFRRRGEAPQHRHCAVGWYEASAPRDGEQGLVWAGAGFQPRLRACPSTPWRRSSAQVPQRIRLMAFKPHPSLWLPTSWAANRGRESTLVPVRGYAKGWNVTFAGIAA
jgi:hypothetical protein